MPDTNADTSTTADQSLTITIDGCSLPDDRREETLEQLKTALESLLCDHYSSAAATATVRAGQQFPAISDTCPLCATDLNLTEFTIDTENGATATAACQSTECDWYGWAVYRIIDLEWHAADEIGSVVETGHVTPRWQPY